MWVSTKGKLRKNPFAPPMYDYEYHPQDVSGRSRLLTLRLGDDLSFAVPAPGGVC